MAIYIHLRHTVYSNCTINIRTKPVLWPVIKHDVCSRFLGDQGSHDHNTRCQVSTSSCPNGLLMPADPPMPTSDGAEPFSTACSSSSTKGGETTAISQPIRRSRPMPRRRWWAWKTVCTRGQIQYGSASNSCWCLMISSLTSHPELYQPPTWWLCKGIICHLSFPTMGRMKNSLARKTGGGPSCHQFRKFVCSETLQFRTGSIKFCIQCIVLGHVSINLMLTEGHLEWSHTTPTGSWSSSRSSSPKKRISRPAFSWKLEDKTWECLIQL